MCFDHPVQTVDQHELHLRSNSDSLFICALSSRPQAIANRPCGYENGTQTQEYKLLKYLRMHQVMLFPETKIQ